MYPHERSLVERLKDEPFALIGINSDDSPETIADAMERENITWPSFFDGGVIGGPIATRWGVYGWPTIYVIDHKGVIRYLGVRGEAMDRAVDTLLEEMRQSSGNDPEAELRKLMRRVTESELEGKERAEVFSPEFEAFARKYDGTESALIARLWLFRQLEFERDSVRRREAIARIMDKILPRHLDSPQLTVFGEYAHLFSSEQKERYFAQLMGGSPHAGVRGTAIYVLSELGIPQSAPEQIRMRRPILLRQLIDEYSDVTWRFNTTLGEIAEANLNPHDPADLAVGKPAPEIVGSTYDGRPLRLSDYRGKVVLLDFWGDW